MHDTVFTCFTYLLTYADYTTTQNSYQTTYLALRPAAESPVLKEAVRTSDQPLVPLVVQLEPMAAQRAARARVGLEAARLGLGLGLG